MSETKERSNPNLPACQPLTVCQILPGLDEGGMERSAVDMAVAVVKAGGRALVVSGGGRLVPELLRSGGKHLEFRTETNRPLVRWWRAVKLARALKGEGYRIIHARTPATTALGVAVARRLDARLISTFHSLEEMETAREKRAIKAVARADRVVAVSDYVAGRLKDTHGVAPSRTAVVPPGINLARYNPAAVKADRFIKLAQRWLLPDGVPVILVPARIVRDKGQVALTDALVLMGDQPFFCLLVGDETVDPPYRAELEAAITEKGLAGKVRLAGFCEDMPAAYMLADAVVDPSIAPEAFGRVAAEALAMGRPVVASNTGGAAELIEPGKTGWTAPPTNSAALADAITKALALSPADREALAMTARTRIARDYSLERMCGETLALYRDVLTGPADA